MAIWDNIDEVNATEAPNHWEMRTDNSGVITITENRVGNLTSICNWVNSYVVGNQGNPTFEGTPKNAVFYVSGKTVSMTNAGITQGSVSWSTASGEGDESQTSGALSASESVDFTLVETPLGLNGNFVKDVPENETLTCEELNGVTVRKAIELYVSESDPETAKKYSGYINSYNDGVAGKWAEKILAGVTHYLEPSPTASRTEEHTESPTNIGSGVGLTGDPVLLKINMGFTSNWAWLKSGDSVQWSSQTGRFTRTQSWIACRGEWDKDIYKDASSNS